MPLKKDQVLKSHQAELLKVFNLYEMYKKARIEHLIAWEAYQLENELVVKIDPMSDKGYPFKIGQTLSFVSHNKFTAETPLYIYDINDEIRDNFPEIVEKIDHNGKVTYKLYHLKVTKIIDLIKVIDLDNPKFDFELLNFTLNGAPLFAEILVYMMQEIGKLKR